MANKTIEMENLMKEAVRAYTGMTVVFPQFKQEETLNISELAPKFPGCFATNNSTVCFIFENEVFVIPYTRNVINTLEAAGFKKEYFYVPFSNWDYPKNEMLKWNALRQNAQQVYAEEFVEECIAYCDKHNIGAISDETLKNCFEMPASGVKVKHLYFKECFYPIIQSNCLDCVAVDQLGKFCTNNGRVVFVYRDGKTYVTKGYKILSELRAAGYTEAGLFVPFSNGEEILDSGLKAQWDSITK